MAARLLEPSERPTLVAGEPLVWTCTASPDEGRSQLRSRVRRLLSALASHYLEQAADRLPLQFEPGQPPRLPVCWQGLPLSLSISYGNTRAAVALCAGRGVGVDLAPVGAMPDWRQVSRLYLGPGIEDRLSRHPAAARDLQFARCWAKQEARLKSLGLPLQEWSTDLAHRLDAETSLVEMLELDDDSLILALARASH